MTNIKMLKNAKKKTKQKKNKKKKIKKKTIKKKQKKPKKKKRQKKKKKKKKRKQWFRHLSYLVINHDQFQTDVGKKDVIMISSNSLSRTFLYWTYTLICA